MEIKRYLRQVFNRLLSPLFSAKVRSSKKMKRTKNGGLVMVSNKTTIGGDNIVIGEGSKIVNVNIGDRRDRRDRRSKPRSRRSEPSQKPGKMYQFF